MTRWTIILVAVMTATLALEAGGQTWWENETAMEAGGKLQLTGKAWWGEVADLKVNEAKMIQSSEPEGGRMLLRREKRVRAKDAEMLVWILDDDGDMEPTATAGDLDSDCYVVDYDCDGIVDRIVDYVDANGDDIPDEMEIRYFVNGELRNGWFATDLDGDGAMWDIADYAYTGNFFKSDPYGDNEIYMNKYNPNTGNWMPISECPFAFFDTDGDGQSECTVRFSSVPLLFSKESDPDYANSIARYQGPHDPAMEKMGVVNIRYSIDIDDRSSDEVPLHYEMGFTMIGTQPYEFRGMRRTQLLRRAPNVTVCIPHASVRRVSERYDAAQTGFTWREFDDTTVRIGHPVPEYDRRWEGVFWTWQRRILHNTGGPVQEWNVRREYLPTASNRRDIYYSPVDRRLHLKGATEGWIRMGNMADEGRTGETRMFDTDGDGYFDRWEHFGADDVLPYRTATVSDAKNVNFGSNWKKMSSFYTETVLPEAIVANKRLIAAIEALGEGYAPAIPEYLSASLRRDDISPDERRYVLDRIREYRYQSFRKLAWKDSGETLLLLSDKDPRSNKDIMESSSTAWQTLVGLAGLERLYERGEYGEVAKRIQPKK